MNDKKVEPFHQIENWPVLREEIYYTLGDTPEKYTTELAFSGHSEIVEIKRDGKGNLASTCTTTFGTEEDFQRRECDFQTLKTSQTNSFDTRGRLIKTITLHGNEPVKKWEVEYSGDNEIYRTYGNGILEITVLGEKFEDRTKYTTWDFRAASPGIHIRDYRNSGEGTELFLSPRSGRETSATKVFSTESEKISITYEITQRQPGGVVFLNHSGQDMQGKRYFRKEYKYHPKTFNLDSVENYDAAKDLLDLSVLMREDYRYSKKIDNKQHI